MQEKGKKNKNTWIYEDTDKSYHRSVLWLNLLHEQKKYIEQKLTIRKNKKLKKKKILKQLISQWWSTWGFVTGYFFYQTNLGINFNEKQRNIKQGAIYSKFLVCRNVIFTLTNTQNPTLRVNCEIFQTCRCKSHW